MNKNSGNNQNKTKNIGPFFVSHFKIITILNIILIFSLGYLFLLRSKFTQLETGVNVIEEAKETELRNKEKYLENLKKYESELGLLATSDRERLDNFLPPGAGIPELLIQVSALARETGFQLDSISFAERKVSETRSVSQKTDQATEQESLEEGSEGLKELKKTESEGTGQVESTPSSEPSVPIQVLKVSLSLSQGDYFSFKAFLKSLEKNLRLFDIVAINFVSESDLYVVNLKTYYQDLIEEGHPSS